MLKRKALTLIMAAAVSMSAMTSLSASVSAEWVKSSSGYSYKDDETGKKLTGWQTIGSGKYYFDKNGVALTGWKKISGDTYYFNKAKKGKMVTSWVTIGDNKYYFGSDGVMRTGWIKLSGKTYYFGTDGKMRTGKRKISGKVYDFGTDGVLKSTTASSSSSKLTKPYNNVKWGMSMDDVIEAKNLENYLTMEPMLVVYDTDPFIYYLFDDNDSLCGYGYLAEYSSSDVKKFKKYFTDAGWKLAYKAQDDSYVYLYTKDDVYGAVVYDSEACMTVVLSDALTEDAIDGTIDSIITF